MARPQRVRNRAAEQRSLAGPMAPRPFQLVNLWHETNDTFTFTARPLGETARVSFVPGQFNMLYAFGVGEAPISISGDPAERGAFAHSVRTVGDVTRALRDLEPGDALGLRGPFGTAWPVQEANGSDVLLIAGGIGLAPLRPVLYQIAARREEFGSVTLLYGARSPLDLLYVNQFESWRRRGIEVEVTVDSSGVEWQGHVGVVTHLIPRAKFDPHKTIAMVCGPEVMMRFTLLDLEKEGVVAERIFVSMERNMKCALGHCGHCQFGPFFVCKDGPVFRYDRVAKWLGLREI